jgi:hypothetical protein
MKLPSLNILILHILKLTEHFRLSRWFDPNVDPVFGWWHRVNVVCIADISEILFIIIWKAKRVMTRLHASPKSLVFITHIGDNYSDS